MADKALGLIETKGLIGAIEACDAAAKAAAVIVSSIELTDAAFVTLKIEGDLGAVQAAVDAGASAAEKIGELVAVHVIPNPASELAPILPDRRYVSKYHPEDIRPMLSEDDAEDDMPITKPVVTKKKPAVKAQKAPKPSSSDSYKKLMKMTVSQLRQLARSLEHFPLKGREISMANKTKLLDAFKSILDTEE